MADVTQILNAIEQGDSQASEELLPLVYEELRLLAAQKLSHESPGQIRTKRVFIRRRVKALPMTNSSWQLEVTHSYLPLKDHLYREFLQYGI